MKKIFYPLFLTVLFLSGAVNAQAASIVYDQKVSVAGQEVATIHVTSKEENVRAESKIGNLTAVMIRNETGAYSYLPQQNIMTKIPAEMDRPNLTREIPRFMDYLGRNQAKKTVSETLGQYQTDVYEFVEPTTQKPAKAWVWAEKQFPIKIEVEAPEGLTSIEMSNITFDAPIDDKSFVLPEGAKLVDFSAPAPEAVAEPATPEAGAEAPAAPVADQT